MESLFMSYQKLPFLHDTLHFIFHCSQCTTYDKEIREPSFFYLSIYFVAYYSYILGVNLLRNEEFVGLSAYYQVKFLQFFKNRSN